MDKEIIDLVKEEAGNLKAHAREQELALLNFDFLEPNDIRSCIYGQMTGNCFSKRASGLIQKCCSRVLHQQSVESLYQCTLNGKPDFVNRNASRGAMFSPIECFITHPSNKKNGNNKMLVSYLCRSD